MYKQWQIRCIVITIINDECDLVHICKCCNTFNGNCHMSARSALYMYTFTFCFIICVFRHSQFRVNRFPHSFGWYAGQVRARVEGELAHESNGTEREIAHQQRKK